MPDPVLQYALDVVEGREVAGPLVRLAGQRHIDDLANGEKRGLWFDLPAAEKVFGFFEEVLHLSGGESEGKPFQLHPAQKFILGSLFGWKYEAIRRFRTAYIEMGKGNGKSPLAAGIGLYMLTADKEARAEVYSAAVDKDQARILFRDAVAMVDQSPALSRRITKSGGKDGDVTKVWNLAYLETGSFFRPISSESKGRGKSGFRPYCVLLDEIHEHPTDAMVEFTRKNMKGRPNALAIMITNSGVYDPTSVCFRYHEYSDRMLNGTTENDDAFFAYTCGLDRGDDWRNANVWKKSCPLLDVSVPRSYLEQEVRESVGMPSRQSLTRRLNFCEWMEASNPFIESEVWRANGGKVSLDELRGKSCYGGLDLSGKNDLTALVLDFPLPDGSDAILPFFFSPKDGLRQREDRDRAPYSQWEREGYLKTTPGKTIDFGFVAQFIGNLRKEYQIELIGFDRWRIDDMVKELDDEGVDVALVPHGQGFQDMNPSIEALEDRLLEGKIRHGNHPILTWCIANAQVEKDKAGNRSFTKRKSTGRIDGAVALAMAAGVAAKKRPEPSYQVFFVG